MSDSTASALPSLGGSAPREQEHDEGWTKKGQPQEPVPSRDATPRIGPMGSTPDDAVIDAGIAEAVAILHAAGVETFESCEGGEGHAFNEPTIRFHGERTEGFRALAIAQQHGLPVAEIRRQWPIIDGEPCGPWWVMTFNPTRQ